MPYTFDRAKGTFYSPDGHAMTNQAYSGHGVGLDNPAMEDMRNVGPLPAGLYTIGRPRSPIDHLGPLAMPLAPDPGNAMDGRGGFFVHGDNAARDHSASDGCVILPRWVRAIVAGGEDRGLVVV